MSSRTGALEQTAGDKQASGDAEDLDNRGEDNGV